MPLTAVFNHAASHGTRCCLSVNGVAWSYKNVAAASECLAARLQRLGDSTIAVHCHDVVATFTSMLAVHTLHRNLVLLPTEMPTSAVDRCARLAGATRLLSDHPADQVLLGFTRWAPALDRVSDSAAFTKFAHVQHEENAGQVILLTSGTGGSPKAAVHTWKTLAAATRLDDRYGDARWLLTYPLSRFAGLQVLLQCVLNGAFLAVPDSLDVAGVSRALQEDGVTHVSGTPTFWRSFLLGTSRRSRANVLLKQITLGGELVRQQLLDTLKSEFPEARITHIYASTELGVCVTVRDGLAGFPAAWLDRPRNGVALRVENGELLARSIRSMKHYLRQPRRGSRWFSTGDLVEMRGDRVRFLGRKDQVINVGGAKVAPDVVEDCIRGVPGVRRVRVHGKASSIAGWIVCADVEPVTDVDSGRLKKQIVARCKVELSPYQIPRIIEFVEAIRTTPAGKVERVEVTT